jgi:hypothetical protein
VNYFQLWKDLHDLFDTDDGSLPEIELTNLNPSQIGSVFSFLLVRGKEKDGRFWDKELKAERNIEDVENAAMLVADYRAHPFHIVLSDIEVDGVTIPALGVFIFQKVIVLDYRMGEGWGPSELGALFCFLSQMKKLAPEMVVKLPQGEPEKAGSNSKRYGRSIF